MKACTHKTPEDHSGLTSHTRGERVVEVRIWRCSACRIAQPWGPTWMYHGNLECRKCGWAQIDFVYCSDACKEAGEADIADRKKEPDAMTQTTLAGTTSAPAKQTCDTVEHYTPDYIIAPVRELLQGIELDPASCTQAQEVVRAQRWFGRGSPDSEDGLAVEWRARSAFLNPPGGLAPKEAECRSNAARWWALFARAWQRGDLGSAVFLGFTLEILRSAQQTSSPQPIHFPICVPRSRIPFDTPNRVVKKKKGKRYVEELIDPAKPYGARVTGSSPAHPNVIIYLPPIPAKYRLNGNAPGMSRMDRGWRYDCDRFYELFQPLGECRT